VDIGAKMKQLRVKNQLTLEELANRSELTKGFLSQVERNLTSPSIATLEDILEALGTTLGEFFSEDKEEQIVFTSNDYFVNEQEDYDISYIVPNAQKNSMEPILIKLHPGCESEKYSPYEGEEFGYVLQGKIELHYGNEHYTVKKGQTFYLKGDKEHYLKNVWESEARVIWVSNPPSF
jgi:transcriptional regulator with XRE-family HTH domain